MEGKSAKLFMPKGEEIMTLGYSPPPRPPNQADWDDGRGGARILSVSSVSFLHSCHWMGVTWSPKQHRCVVWPCREKEKP